MIRLSIALALPMAALAIACSSTSAGNDPACTADGGPVTGPADSHCAAKGGGAPTLQSVDPAACTSDAGSIPVEASADDGGARDANANAMDGGSMPPADNGGFGATMPNAEGDDDDCKYHVVWSAAPLCQGVDTYFTVAVTFTTNGQPATGAPIRPEVFLNDHHPAPNSHPSSTEMKPGVYRVGPVRFDASGAWTVRFHFHEECNDLPQSPHGHAAFFVSVP